MRTKTIVVDDLPAPRAVENSEQQSGIGRLDGRGVPARIGSTNPPSSHPALTQVADLGAVVGGR